MIKRKYVKKSARLILAVVLSAGMLLTGCNTTNNNMQGSINNSDMNTNTDGIDYNVISQDVSGVNHDYPVELLSYDKNDDNYDESNEFNKEQADRSYGTVEEISYYSPTLNKMRNANVFLPKDYDKSKSYPVVYLLHGMGGDYMDYKGLDALDIAQNAVYDYNRNDMILVSFTVFTDTDGKSESDYGFSDLTARYDNCENDVINALIPYINSHYSTKEGREYTAVAGFSLGGREALYLCFAHPDIFGYVGAFAPVGGVVDTGLDEITYGNRGYLLNELVPEGKEAPLLTLIVTGDEDPYCKLSSEYYSKYMTAHSIEHIFYYRPGGHEAVVWNNGLYNFLRRIF